jgi:hypothetical protein
VPEIVACVALLALDRLGVLVQIETRELNERTTAQRPSLLRRVIELLYVGVRLQQSLLAVPPQINQGFIIWMLQVCSVNGSKISHGCTMPIYKYVEDTCKIEG